MGSWPDSPSAQRESGSETTCSPSPTDRDETSYSDFKMARTCWTAAVILILQSDSTGKLSLRDPGLNHVACSMSIGSRGAANPGFGWTGKQASSAVAKQPPFPRMGRTEKYFSREKCGPDTIDP